MNTGATRSPAHFALALAVGLAGCVTSADRDTRRHRGVSAQSTSGEYRSDSGAELFIAPVRARMVTDEAHVHRAPRPQRQHLRPAAQHRRCPPTARRSSSARSTFTQEGQWRNLRENPELFTALLPKDVRPAGTCDIQPSEDRNSLSYSCGGSPAGNLHAHDRVAKRRPATSCARPASRAPCRTTGCCC